MSRQRGTGEKRERKEREEREREKGERREREKGERENREAVCMGMEWKGMIQQGWLRSLLSVCEGKGSSGVN